MNRRDFLYFTGGLVGASVIASAAEPVAPAGREASPKDQIIGMYVHKAWPYHRPYSARCWTLADWRGYAEGCKQLGFNTLIIWPLIETMPHPLSASDRADLQLMAKVIDVVHDLGMRAYMTLLPNVVVDNATARNYSYTDRPYFHALTYANPADRKAVREMIDWREELLRPLSNMDGCAIIDSDTGGYPGSTNEQFVDLLVEHRKMFDRLRPGIELLYWMHVGWEGYCEYYATGKFRWTTPAETKDVLTRLKKANPAPWGISVHSLNPPPTDDFKVASSLGLAAKAVSFNYGAIESEPSFPLTNFGKDTPWRAGHATAPRGVVGNAQTHCLQIPNTFAFARGAKGEPVSDKDYVQLADDLITGKGAIIVEAWRAIGGKDSAAMRQVAAKVKSGSTDTLQPGPLRGLLFGDAMRFMKDLEMQLYYRAAYVDWIDASHEKFDQKTFRSFVAAADAWQRRTGYQCMWRVPEMDKVLKQLNSPAINQLIAEQNAFVVTTQAPGATPFERVRNLDHDFDTYTVRMLTAMKQAAKL